jgi:hypothetical protein
MSPCMPLRPDCAARYRSHKAAHARRSRPARPPLQSAEPPAQLPASQNTSGVVRVQAEAADAGAGAGPSGSAAAAAGVPGSAGAADAVCDARHAEALLSRFSDERGARRLMEALEGEPGGQVGSTRGPGANAKRALQRVSRRCWDSVACRGGCWVCWRAGRGLVVERCGWWRASRARAASFGRAAQLARRPAALTAPHSHSRLGLAHASALLTRSRCRPARPPRRRTCGAC